MPTQHHRDSSSKAKVQQLRKQVERTLYLVFAAQSQNEWLCDLTIVHVEPNNNGTHFVIELATTHNDLESYRQTLQALSQAQGYIRSVLANRMSRRKVPSLSFQLIPMQQNILR